MPDHSQLWTEHDVARYLNVSNWTVRSWRQQGKLGYTELGGVIRYVPSEVRAFALAGRKAPRCPECGNNSPCQGGVPEDSDSGEPKYFSDLRG